MSQVLLITGTDTGVGKTIATAALAVHFSQQGRRVGVVKPVQSGVEDGEQSDVETVARLSGIAPEDTYERVRLPEPLAPTQAASRAGVALPPMREHAAFIAGLVPTYDVILVEGAGGISVPLDAEDHTLIDLAHDLQALDLDPHAVIVNRAGLGTLNHTRLTVWMLQTNAVPLLGTVVGAAPNPDDVAGQLNIDEMKTFANSPLLTVLPDHLGDMDHNRFTATLTAHWQAHPISLG
ncbi:dethiobiotin synthase [Stomatohabitans albus]|uniref:dethiobiotin synthase n=1 Tax=Stomatohabitans albus TaxID=3110766 RepID=UPI00300C0180